MLDLTTLEQERSRELVLDTAKGEVRFTMRQVTPKLLEKWRRRVIAHGICRKDMEINGGRFGDYCKAIAEDFITGWAGVTRAGEPVAYEPILMAQILENRTDVMKAVQQALSEDGDFFGSNGSGPPKS